jgi:hypothetical protein
LTDAERDELFECLKPVMQAAYSPAEDPAASAFLGWWRYSTSAYPSATHGGRYVLNFGNRAGKDYIKYEDGGTLPAGSVIAKPSFGVSPTGQALLGPLFLMEKMAVGFDEAAGN